jgi:AraC-like DNA-binding protein
MSRTFDDALKTLAERFPTLDWTYYDVPGTGGEEQGWHWLGAPDESVMVCVFSGNAIHEHFHRQDFFFFNFAYRGSFACISQRRENHVTVSQGEMVVGQPFTGYALDGESAEPIVNIGVLIRPELFYERMLPLVSRSASLLHFFVSPETNRYSDDFLHLSARRGYPYRELVRLMTVEYAKGGEGSQDLLATLAYALTMYVARQYKEENPEPPSESLVGRVEDYITADLAGASVEGAAKELGYHPNYLSTLVRRESGRTFTQLRTELRLRRADLLLRQTSLSVESIASMLGYSSTSNFYAAYRKRFGHSPRGEAAGKG